MSECDLWRCCVIVTAHYGLHAAEGFSDVDLIEAFVLLHGVTTGVYYNFNHLSSGQTFKCPSKYLLAYVLLVHASRRHKLLEIKSRRLSTWAFCHVRVFFRNWHGIAGGVPSSVTLLPGWQSVVSVEKCWPWGLQNGQQPWLS
jgi:hypothetical protein